MVVLRNKIKSIQTDHFLLKTPFRIVLVEPEIPPNTGNIARLCLATGTELHLVEPLGFNIDEKSLRRAGLDYWSQVSVTLWPSFAAFREWITENSSKSRIYFLTTKTTKKYWDQSFAEGDILVFGRETKGLPDSLLNENPDDCLTIPMENSVRSLNLATSAGIVLYEALRQQF